MICKMYTECRIFRTNYSFALLQVSNWVNHVFQIKSSSVNNAVLHYLCFKILQNESKIYIFQIFKFTFTVIFSYIYINTYKRPYPQLDKIKHPIWQFNIPVKLQTSTILYATVSTKFSLHVNIVKIISMHCSNSYGRIQHCWYSPIRKYLL